MLTTSTSNHAAMAQFSDLQLSDAESRRLVILGSAHAGKTSLLSRFSTNTFSDDYKQTFGAELMVKLHSTDTKRCQLHMWCCAGHERYRTLLEQFFVHADAALIVFDMLDVKSFQEAFYWYNEMKRVAADAKLYLVGTKTDEADKVVVKLQDAQKQAAEWGAQFRAVSSKTGMNVQELFHDIVHDLI